jgi:hypothetical protein
MISIYAWLTNITNNDYCALFCVLDNAYILAKMYTKDDLATRKFVQIISTSYAPSGNTRDVQIVFDCVKTAGMAKSSGMVLVDDIVLTPYLG